MNRDKIPYEGHLIRAVQRVRLQMNLTRQLVALAREADAPLPVGRATAGGDPQRLRGIPVCGRGIAGSRPEWRPEASIGRLDRNLALLAAIARDLDGTSPGSQPEDALLDKERNGTAH